MELPQPGQTFAARYELREIMGEGGFAVVFDALDAQRQRAVALKILKPMARDGYPPDVRARFERETALLRGLQNLHIVRLLDHGESADGLLYMSFDPVPGEDLSERLKRDGVLAPAEVDGILRQVLVALADAHAAGLVHRDIKPENIRVFEDPHIPFPLAAVLLDFGIARATDYGHPSITKTGELVGTPRYMSPEQLLDKPLDARSDIYSLGMVAFEAVVGGHEMPEHSWGAQLDRLHTGHIFSVPALQRAGTMLPVIQRMTARKPEDRYPSARAVLADLDRAAGMLPPDAGLQEQAASNPSPRQSQSRLLGVAAALAIAVLIFGTAHALGFLDVDEPSPPSALDSKVAQLPASDLAVPAQPTHHPDLESAARPPEDVGADSRRIINQLATADTEGCENAPPKSAGSIGKEFFYAVPDDYDHTRLHPLLLVLHTDYVAPDDMMRNGGLIELAHQRELIVIAPQDGNLVVGGVWRDADDIAKVEQAYLHATKKFCVDPRRVFVVGHGDGARVALPLSLKPWVTAIAVNSYGLRPEQSGSWRTRQKPMIWLHPRDSPFVPLDGTPNCNGKVKLSVDQTKAQLRTRNKCSTELQSESEHDGGRCEQWKCDVGTKFCLIDGGTPWPGTTLTIESCKPNRAPSFPVLDEIWQFFESVAPRGLHEDTP